jgi:archaemetzincin
MDTVKAVIIEIYGFDVRIADPIETPSAAYVNIKSPRYRADSLIRYLRKIKADSIDFIMGLTSKDISVTQKDKDGKIKAPEYKYRDWGIFGLAFMPGESSIVSTYRLRSNKQKFIERFKKVCVHELGHNLGLAHCTKHDKCVMRDAAETIKTVDHVDLYLCDKCKQRIKRF